MISTFGGRREEKNNQEVNVGIPNEAAYLRKRQQQNNRWESRNPLLLMISKSK
jgi:hypothetical protein